MGFMLVLFLCGWAMGIVVEWAYHRVMRDRSFDYHVQHHKDFFHLEGNLVARMARCLVVNFRYAGYVLIAVSPLMLVFGWLPILLLYGGAMWHLLVFYQVCHAVIHDDRYVPALVKERALYKWWRGCHLEHHFYSPRKNYCVTNPVLDMFLGTYQVPRASFPEVQLKPHRKPEGKR